MGGQIARIHEVGALPHYGGTSAGAVRVSGLPYGDSASHLMEIKLWKDVRTRRVMVVHVDDVAPDNQAIPTTTTTDVEKLPDRELPTDV